MLGLTLHGVDLFANNMKSSYIQWIALRQLLSSTGRQGLSFMTVFSILGVTLGVAALIIVLSVMGGFEQDLKQKMLRGEPHIEILAKNALLGFSLNQVPLKKIESALGARANISPFAKNDVVAKQGKHLAAVTLIGIDPEKNNSMWAFHDTLVDGELSDLNKKHTPLLYFGEGEARFPGIILGEGVAGQLGADMGDKVTILSPQAVSGNLIFSGGTITRTYVVTGIFSSHIFTFDSKWAVVNLSEGRKFLPDYDPSLDQENYVTGIAADVFRPDLVDRYVKRLSKVAKDMQFLTWKDSNKALLFALQLEKYTMGAILMLIVLVAAFSISGTMMMTVFHKKSQISLMRSLGMSRQDISRLYILQGLTIGVIGTLLGLALGLLICYGLQEGRYAGMPASIMSIRGLPVRFLPVEYFCICVAALLLAAGGALYPALIASRQNPSAGLRYS